LVKPAEDSKVPANQAHDVVVHPAARWQLLLRTQLTFLPPNTALPASVPRLPTLFLSLPPLSYEHVLLFSKQTCVQLRLPAPFTRYAHRTTKIITGSTVVQIPVARSTHTRLKSRDFLLYSFECPSPEFAYGSSRLPLSSALPTPLAATASPPARQPFLNIHRRRADWPSRQPEKRAPNTSLPLLHAAFSRGPLPLRSLSGALSIPIPLYRTVTGQIFRSN